MTKEITAYLMLSSKSEPENFSRKIKNIVALDEGYSRPVWTWIQSSHSPRTRLNRWVPNSPSSALKDGVFMLMAEGLGNELSAAALKERAHRQVRNLVDLQANPLSSWAYDLIPEVLSTFKLHVVAFEGSLVTDLVNELRGLGVTVEILAPGGN